MWMAAAGGLARQARALYREVLRVARDKAGGEWRASGLKEEARRRFDEAGRRVGKRDFQLAEHLIRQGKRQVETIKGAEVSGVSSKVVAPTGGTR